MFVNNSSPPFHFVVVIILLLQHCFATAQNQYEFTPPSSVYIHAFKTITENPYNKEIINFTQRSHSIYINGSTINGNEKYIQKVIAKIDSSFTLNYFTLNYIKAYAYYPKKIAYATYLFNYYSPEIIKNIKANDLPVFFKYLPLVCSGFNPSLTYQQNNVDFWMLDYVPSIKYNLTISKYIDERRDFKKSTIAATQYLKHLYTLYNDWELSLAAYSCGIARVNKLLSRHNTSLFWDIYPYLPEGKRDLVPALIAMTYCYNEAANDNYLLDQMVSKNDTIFIEKELLFKAVSDVIRIKPEKLSFLNPTLISTTFPAHFSAIFPQGTAEMFTDFKDSIYYYQDSVLLKPKPIVPKVIIPKNGTAFTYTVKSGDVLGLIASRYHVGVSQLQNWNDLHGTRIDVGQKLTIYGKNSTKKNKQKTVKSNKSTTSSSIKIDKNTPYTIYTVKSGDSLWLIAKKIKGVSAQNIMDFNAIPENLTVGQKIKIPKHQ